MSEDDAQVSEKIQGPGKSAIGVAGITAVTAYLMAVSFLVIWALVALWPPLKPSEVQANKNANANQKTTATIFRGAANGRGSSAPRPRRGCLQTEIAASAIPRGRRKRPRWLGLTVNARGRSVWRN